jgi:hypothetical protein
LRPDILLSFFHPIFDYSTINTKSMKTIFTIVCLFTFGLHAQVTKSVLFLGNSYTAVNNLPQLTADLALSAGDTLTFNSNTPGGYTLDGHSTNATSLQLIAQGNWDFVVLQEQSQLPSFPIGQVQTDCFPYAAILDSLITDANSCTETMFYMTWGRENGDASNCGFYPPVCTYQGMDSLLRLRYDQMAVDNHGVLSPVGALWNYLRTNNPGLQLYQADESHPSLEGSYAAACSFYATIFRKDPTLITDDYGLPGAVALGIRNAAKAVVYDSLLTWHIGEYDPVASFTDVASFLTVVFTNTSTNATNYLWNFGDGTTSNLQNPIHVFPGFGPYYVQLIVENCGLTDTADTYLNFYGGLDENGLIVINISPNPATNFVQLHIERIDNLQLIDAVGKEFQPKFAKKGDGFEIDLSQLHAGIYWLKIESEGKLYGAKVIKE